MKLDGAENRKPLWRQMLPRILKAGLKVSIVLIVFMLISNFLKPFNPFLGGFNMVIDVFFIAFIAFIIIIELFSGSIFQHLFSVAKNLFMLFYLMYIFDRGIFALTIENVYVTVDLRIIVATLILLDVLALAKSMINTVNFLSEKEEQSWNMQQLQIK